MMARFSKLRIPAGRAFLTWPPVLALLGVAVGLLGFSAGRVVLRAVAIDRERSRLEAGVKALEAETIRLREALGVVASPEAVERLAKERLNLKNPGEEVVVIAPINLPASSTPIETAAGRGRSWLGALFEFLGR